MKYNILSLIKLRSKILFNSNEDFRVMAMSIERFRALTDASVKRVTERRANTSTDEEQLTTAKEDTLPQQSSSTQPRFVRAESFSGE